MSWEVGNQGSRDPGNKKITEEIAAIKGYIEEEKEAKLLLIKFFMANPSLFAEYLTGKELFPYQGIMLNTMMQTDYFLGIISRGGAKSWLSAMYIIMDSIINQGISTGVLAASFRQAKMIFKYILDIASKPQAKLLKDCLGKLRQSNDEWSLEIGDSTVYSLPLGDGCLAANSLIHTNSGIINLGDLFPKNLDTSIDHQEFEVSSNFNIKSINSFINCDQKFYNGIRDTIKIRTKLGYEIEATPNHKFKVVDPDTGDFIWKQLQDITKEDYLVMSASEEWHDNETDITEEEAYAAGLIIGDGCLAMNSMIGFATVDHELVEHLEKANIMKSWTPSNDGQHYYGIGGEGMKQSFMKKMGINQENIRTLDKCFPSRILKSNKSVVANFISGLFDTDGGIQVSARKGYNSCCVSFYNCSKVLCQELHQILLNFGIKSYLSRGKKTTFDKRFGEVDWSICYQLQITGKDIKSFYEKIGFKLSRKQKLLKQFCENKRRWFDVGKNTSVNVVKSLLVEKATSAKRISRKYNINLHKLGVKKNLTQDCICQCVHDYDLPEFTHLVSDGVFFQQIDSIKKAKSPTYDLHIPSTHQYNANGFVVHNSKLRGFRFQRIVIDEGLLMPEKALTEVIMPFLSNVTNPTERANLARLEDRLINEGKMTESERFQWPNNKMMILSSASYKFEYLYKGLYSKYEQMILGNDDDKEKNPFDKDEDGSNAHRAIIQISYDMLPKELHDKNLIAHSRATMSQAQFDREFGGQFTDDSDGYFKAAKMEQCTFEDGTGQSIEIKGEPKAEYLLAFDPSWSESETSDDFAMQVFKLEKGEPKGILVHSYALCGTKLSDHIFYFHYLLTHFNIVAICGDYNGGVQFISAVNESSLFKKAGIEIKMIETEMDSQEEYQERLKEARSQYNLDEKRICILRKPTSQWIRKANELLQGSFEHKRIMFASRASDDAYLYQKSKAIPIEKIKFSNSMDFEDTYKEAKEGPMSKKVDFIEHQWDMINLTKTECALITITTTPQGNQTFDLPQNLKRQTGPDRARKDSYSALVLGAWMIKTYYDMMSFEPEKKVFGFRPYVIH